MNDAGFYNARNYGTDKGDGKGVVDVVFERGGDVVLAVVRYDVEKGAD